MFTKYGKSSRYTFSVVACHFWHACHVLDTPDLYFNYYFFYIIQDMLRNRPTSCLLRFFPSNPTGYRSTRRLHALLKSAFLSFQNPNLRLVKFPYTLWNTIKEISKHCTKLIHVNTHIKPVTTYLFSRNWLCQGEHRCPLSTLSRKTVYPFQIEQVWKLRL